MSQVRQVFTAPSGATDDLLSVILGSEPEAHNAWNRWVKSNQFDHISHAEMQLLVTALPKLVKLNADVPDLPRIQGLAKRTYAKQAALWHTISTVSNLLGAEGIRVILMGEMAAAAEFYGPGERPVTTADLLVCRADFDTARKSLVGQGAATPKFPDRPFDPNFGEGEAWQMGSTQLVLHARLCQEVAPGASAEANFWRRAQAAKNLPANETWASPPLLLAPEDRLLHQAISQTSGRRAPAGLVDSARLVIQRGASLDWETLVDEASSHRVSLRVAAMLTYLRDTHSIEIPERPIARLHQCAAPFEAKELAQIAKPTRWHAVQRKWFNFRRRESQNDRATLRLLRFGAYLYTEQGRPSPLAAAQKLFRYVKENSNRKLP